MGKIVELMKKKKKKKKGRPSLLDLQKRNLKQQLYPHHHHSNNYTPSTPLIRRSSRRNNSSSPDKKNLNNLIPKLPHESDSNPSDSNRDDREDSTFSVSKKRKITAIKDGSSQKGENLVATANHTNNIQDSGPSTPLPDKKLLQFILDRLQKKDTYGVFSEPVDPNELPDYLEVIDHPMDFGTVRKNLSGGAYGTLEQFEKDVFLICSNAMQYNAPDTIYFRQARSIKELAQKNFANLRQDSDDNEPEPKVVRRGRPPTKSFTKPPTGPSLDRAGSEFSSDATAAAAGVENAIWSSNDLRKGPLLADKVVITDSSGQFHGPRNDAAYWLAEYKFDSSGEATGMFKSNSMKNGKKQIAHEESKRNTYKQFHQSAAGREPSVLTTFDAERKQLMAVGLFTDHGYSRSLARFAANVGTIAWKIASKRIEKSLPPGLKFGPGWVGENDIPPPRLLLSVPSSLAGHQTLAQLLPFPENSCAAAPIFSIREKKEKTKAQEDDLLQKQLPSTPTVPEGHPSNSLSPRISAAKSRPGACKSEVHRKERAEATDTFNSHSEFNVQSSCENMIRSRPPSHTHGGRGIHTGTNGFNGVYGYNLPGQMVKTTGPPKSSDSNKSSEIVDTGHSAMASSLDSENLRPQENSNTTSSTHPLPLARSNAMEEAPISELQSPRPCRQASTPQPKQDSTMSPQQKTDAVPPDLNVRFQSSSSPSSSCVDSTQPDLALQL